MAEYRIVTAIDPSGVKAGGAVVKQELRQIAQEGSSTTDAINRAFDHQRFDATVGSLITELKGVRDGLSAIAPAAAAAAPAATALDRITEASKRGAAAAREASAETTASTAATNAKSAADTAAAASANQATAATQATVAASGQAAAAQQAQAGATATNTNAQNQGRQAAQGNATANAELAKLISQANKELADEAQAQQRVNTLLAEAKVLLGDSAEGQAAYQRVVALATQAGNRNTVSLGQQRAGYTQLGFQVQDITSTLALGINPLTVLAQQGGQTASALSLALGSTGAAGKAATFLAGPFGSIVLAATAVVGKLAYESLNSNSALEDGIEKLKEDARETEITRRAREAFSHTIEGQIEAQRRLNDELEKGIQTQRQSQQLLLFKAQQSVADQQRSRPGLVQDISRQQNILRGYQNQLNNPVGLEPEAIAGIAAAAAKAQSEVNRLQTQLRDLDGSIARGEGAVRAAEAPLIQSDVQASLDGRAAAARRYTIALGNLNNQLRIGAGRQAQVREQQPDGTFRNTQVRGIDTAEYRRRLLEIERQRDAAEKAAADATRASSRGPTTGFINPVVGGRISSGFGPRAAPTAGASTFHKGIDIAAPVGTGVRAAAGGVVIYAGKLGGLGNAIIVDHGGGTITEYGHLSQVLTQKGARVGQGDRIGAVGSTGISTGPHLDYRVKVGGRYVDPRGGRFRTDETATDVRAANAAEAAARKAQAERDKAERKAEQERDFVTGVENEAASRGLGAQADTLQGRIDRTLADFKKRFDREASQGERTRITKALTDADARETATRFDQAYVQPLQRLQALQGKAGADREVLNRQLEESQRLGRELTPVEAQQIENSVRQGDALQRQASILESVQQPLSEYQASLAALNKLLADGSISQTTYNARVADLGSTARQLVGGLPGADPATGQSYADIGAAADESARYAKEQQDLADNRQQLLQLGLNYDALTEAAAKKHSDNLRKIEQARHDVQISAAQSIGDSLLSIAENSVGKQNAVYKSLFLATKAFAIAEAIINIQRGVAQAAALPFPANIPAIASVVAATASIVSNISSVALNLRDGGGVDGRRVPPGFVTGPGTPTSDSIRNVNLSDGEFVVNARGTARNRAALEAINAGGVVGKATRLAQGGYANDNAPAVTPYLPRDASGARDLREAARSSSITSRARQAANDQAVARAAAARPVNINIDASDAPGIEFETVGVTEDQVEIIARRAVQQHAGKAVGRELANPNSAVSKAVNRNTTAKRNRN